MKTGIINLRKQIFNTLKEKAYSYEGQVSAELIEYKKNQELLSQREYHKSNIQSLLESVTSSSVVYLGDFHTFDQNIRNVLRIVRHLVSNKDSCIIGLEMVDAKYQLYIDSYLEGHITDLEFLESIEYHDSWRFPWSHYKLIFELAKKNAIRIIGLNTNGSLSERDTFSSKLIRNILEKNKVSKILIVYGELHISNNKIPKLVSKQSNLKQTIIHQNLDQVYWAQIEENQDYDIVQFEKDEFCINSAPPWIKYESMIYWYENLCDDPDFDIHNYIIENGKKIFSDDTNDNFSILCEQLVKASGLQIEGEALNDYNIYDHTKLDFIEKNLYMLESQEQIDFYTQLISRGFSFKLPLSNSYYCSSYSVNRLAYLAGIHIFYSFQQETLKNKNSFFVEKGTVQFTKIVYEYIFAYFFSKVINPHRKCPLYKDFVNTQMTSTISRISKKVLDESNLENIIRDYSIQELIFSAIDIGHLLGEYFYRLLNQEEKNISLKESFKNVQFDNFSFQKLKKNILENFDYKEHLKRYF